MDGQLWGWQYVLPVSVAADWDETFTVPPVRGKACAGLADSQRILLRPGTYQYVILKNDLHKSRFFNFYCTT